MAEPVSVQATPVMPSYRPSRAPGTGLAVRASEPFDVAGGDLLAGLGQRVEDPAAPVARHRPPLGAANCSMSPGKSRSSRARVALAWIALDQVVPGPFPARLVRRDRAATARVRPLVRQDLVNRGLVSPGRAWRQRRGGRGCGRCVARRCR